MVRGLTKQVIVVNASSTDFFEQAIFILKPEWLKEGIADKELLQQARTVLQQRGRNKYGRLRAAGFMLAGVLLSCCIWCVCIFL